MGWKNATHVVKVESLYGFAADDVFRVTFTTSKCRYARRWEAYVYDAKDELDAAIKLKHDREHDPSWRKKD